MEVNINGEKKINAVISINKKFLKEISVRKTLFVSEDEITGLLNICLFNDGSFEAGILVFI